MKKTKTFSFKGVIFRTKATTKKRKSEDHEMASLKTERT